MTSFLLRSGVQLEARLASNTLWSSGKRKRGDWICKDCRRRGSLRQRRTYSEGAWGLVPPTYFNGSFPPGAQKTGETGADAARHAPSLPKLEEQEKGTTAASRGIGIDDGTEATQEMNTGWSDSTDRQTKLREEMERSGNAGFMTTALEDEPEAPGASYQPFAFKVLDIDYATILDDALQDNNPDLVARCLLEAERKDDRAWIRGLSAPTFTRCIEVISAMTDKFTTLHVDLSHARVEQLHLQSIEEVAREHSFVLMECVALRRSGENEIKLPLQDYRLLLEVARNLGNKDMAIRIWKWLLNDGLTPDTSCYNSYMAANLEHGRHLAVARHKLRVIPFNVMARQAEQPSEAFSTYRVHGDGSIKTKVLHFFGEGLKNGIIADEDSYCIVLTAAAREGDTQTVKNILKRVWNIDVDAIESEQLDDPSALPKTSKLMPSLVPTSRLLFAIAHSFGINNDVPTALRLVDFVARHYNLTIDLRIWNELLQWTQVLSTPRTGIKSRTDGSLTGQLPPPSVLALWETMIGAPYNIMPTVSMYNRLIRSLQLRDMTDALAEKIYEARSLILAMRKKERIAWESLQQSVALNKIEGNTGESTRNVSLERHRREWEHLALLCRRNATWSGRWLRLFLATTRSRANVDYDGEWALRIIPTVLWDWRHYVAVVVKYHIAGGTVALTMRAPDEIAANRRRKERRVEREDEILGNVPLAVGEAWARPDERKRVSQVAEAGQHP